MTNQPLRLAWVILFLALGLAMRGGAEEPALTEFRGPSPVGNERPYQLLFLAFDPENATTLARNQSSLGLRLDLANDLLLPNPSFGAVVEEDTETQRVTLTLRRGLGHATDVRLQVPFMARNGGITDNLIRTYHFGVGLTKTSSDVFVGRPNVPSYRSILRFLRPDGTAVVDAHPATGLGDASVFLKRGVFSDGRTAAAVRLGLKLPTGDAKLILGSGGVDAGVDVDVMRRLRGRRALFADLGFIRMAKDRSIETAATSQVQYAVGLEWLVRRRESWVLQTEGGSRVVRTNNAHADATPATLAVAYKRQAGPHTVYTFTFMENGDIFGYHLPFLANIGPDATLSFGVEWRR